MRKKNNKKLYCNFICIYNFMYEPMKFSHTCKQTCTHLLFGFCNILNVMELFIRTRV